VCERSQIAENICPNCETDLSTYKMLANLPIQESVEKQQRIIPIWLPIGVAILFLLLGLGLGFVGNSVITKQQPQINQSFDVSNSIPEIKPIIIDPKEIEQPKLISCGGFNYVVQKGDSLSLIASHFYGDSNSWLLISKANSAIKGRESLIEIGELILIPNLKNNCLNS